MAMQSKIRLLGIAPYEEMRTQMLALAEEYEEIDLTVFVGDLQQGVELARHNFYNDYDAIISRGGTASLLRERLDLPVIEIPVSPLDIVRAVRLAEQVSDRCAIVGFPNITANAELFCQMIDYPVDIHTIQNAGEVERILLDIRAQGPCAILCDMITKTTAMRLGLDVVLITSGAEGIRAAFYEALRLYHNYLTLREENRFLRSLIWNQINHTVVFNDQGELFFSTLKDNRAPIVDFLREESMRAGPAPRRHILKQINNVQYSIRPSRETFGGKEYTVYYFSDSRVASADILRGIRYQGWPEAEEQYNASLYGIVGLVQDLREQIDRINLTSQPVMVCGEDGTCKEQAVNYLYLHSSRRDRPLVIIDCFMLSDKAWSYLMDHYNSPLAQSGCTIFVKNVDVLTLERRRQMLASILAMDVCKRNRMIFSCVCRTGELSTEAGMEFVERLACLSLYLPPIRQRAAQFPAVANMYLSHLNTTLTKQQVVGLDAQALRQLQEFHWPHNYTQFQRILQELALMAEGPLITAREAEAVLKRERTVATVNDRVEDAGEPLDLSQTLDQINREIIRRVLAEENGNQSRTAARLGISRTTLWRTLNSQQ